MRDQTLWETIIYTSMTALIFIVAIGISRFVGQAVRRLLGELTQVMQKIANGQLAVEVTNRDRADEIGAMAQTVEVFKRNAMSIQSMERERSDAISHQRERFAECSDDFPCGTTLVGNSGLLTRYHRGIGRTRHCKQVGLWQALRARCRMPCGETEPERRLVSMGLPFRYSHLP